MNQSTFGAAELIGPQVLLDVAGTEKQQRLRHRVKGHVQQHANRSQRAPERQAQHHDPAVVDARIRQQPAETPLHQDKGHRDAHRQEAENHQQLRCELRPQTARGQNEEAQQAV